MRKILAVDDHVINLDLLAHILKVFYPDFKFIGVESGEVCIEKATSEQPDLILLDIMMPGLNGYETCRHLKSNIKTAHIPIIMVSALGHDSSERIKGLDAGADSFLSKPFDKVELRAQINVALRIKEYQEKLKRLNTELTLVEEKEKRRIAENLHDSLGQTLSLAYMNLTSINVENCDSKIKKTIDFTAVLLNRGIKETRTLTYDLSPPILYELGFIPALQWKLEQFEKETDIKFKLEFNTEKLGLKKETSIFLYRTFGELLNNVQKHARASEIDVRVDRKDHLIKLSLEDDGVGIDTTKIQSPSHEKGGFGLFSISERLESLNGTFNIEPSTKGTIAKILLPLISKRN